MFCPVLRGMRASCDNLMRLRDSLRPDVVLHEPRFALGRTQFECLVDAAEPGDSVVVPDFPGWAAADARALTLAKSKEVKLVPELSVFDPRLLFFGEADRMAAEMIAFKSRNHSTLHILTPFVWRSLPQESIAAVCRTMASKGVSMRLAGCRCNRDFTASAPARRPAARPIPIPVPY